uniref:Uncharacterized protein n=1 Tax=Paramormyrops kingsleyae TaxID=1676925 RepID=A0A3B3SCB1_9TELE
MQVIDEPQKRTAVWHRADKAVGCFIHNPKCPGGHPPRTAWTQPHPTAPNRTQRRDHQRCSWASRLPPPRCQKSNGSAILALLLAGYFGQQYLPPPKPKVIGLDLGTTFCSVGVFHAGTGDVEVIGDQEGRKSIPSVVSFTATDIHAGYEGQELADSNPHNTIYDAKCFIGKIFDQLKSLDLCLQ